jgi:hypothetical protein
MSVKCPVMSKVDNSHALKTEEVSVQCTVKFSVKYRAYCAHFADEVRKVPNARESQAGLSRPASGERGTDAEALRMIGDPTGPALLARIERKTLTSKVTYEDVLGRR